MEEKQSLWMKLEKTVGLQKLIALIALIVIFAFFAISSESSGRLIRRVVFWILRFFLVSLPLGFHLVFLKVGLDF